MANSISSVTTGTGGIVLESVDTSGNTNIKSGTTTIVAVSSTGAAVTGTLSASGNVTAPNLQGPAFSAYGTALQSLTNVTYTKISFNTESFDTNSNYDTTLYRFTPTIAGYYQINAQSSIGVGVATSIYVLAVGKNGSNAILSGGPLNATNTIYGTVSGLLYLNGSTDYIEVFVYQSSGGALNCGSTSPAIAFSAFLARSA